MAATLSALKMSPYITPVFLEKYAELSKRLLGVPELDKTNSWIPGKIAKPSLDSIGDWIGGRLSKFVAGENEASSLPPEDASVAVSNNSYTGAFSHYSNISSTTPSTSPSPAPSMHNTAVTSEIYQRRSGSAMAIRQSPPTQIPTDRASSAMDYRRPGDTRQDPHRMTSVDSTIGRLAQTRSFSQAMEGSGHVGNGSLHQPETNEGTEDVNTDASGGGWWSAAYGDSNGTTPTATSFFKVENSQDAASPTSGFMSLMDTVTPQFSSSVSSARTSPTKASFVDDDIDDLGLGNSNNRVSKDNDQVTSGANKLNEEKGKEPGNELSAQKPGQHKHLLVAGNITETHIRRAKGILKLLARSLVGQGFFEFSCTSESKSRRGENILLRRRIEALGQ